MLTRLLALAVCFLATTALAGRAARAENQPPLTTLRDVPQEIARWRGQDERRFPADILAVLGVDQYLNRTYFTAGEPFVSLYVGYYQSQRAGDTMHSPLNCLPGAGWQPVETGRIELDAVGPSPAPISINRVVVQKGVDRAIVLYWYQSHGRIVASDYASKFYLVYDSIRLNRSDGALVRVVSPVSPSDRGDAVAEQRATEFVRVLLPLLDRHLPS